MLFWGEKDARGQALTRARLKLTEEGMEKLMERVKASLPPKSGHGARPNLAFDEDMVFTALVDAAKTVNYHKADGNYSLTKLTTMKDAEDHIRQAFRDKVIAEADAKFYLDLVAGIRSAYHNRGDAPYVTRRGVQILPRATSTQPQQEFQIGWKKFTFELKNQQAAEFQATGQVSSRISAQVLEMELDGVKVLWKPYERPHNTDYFAIQGLVEFELRDDRWRVYYRWDYTPEQIEKSMMQP